MLSPMKKIITVIAIFVFSFSALLAKNNHNYQEGDIVEITADDYVIYDGHDQQVKRELQTIKMSADALRSSSILIIVK